MYRRNKNFVFFLRFEKSDVKVFHRMWTYMQQSDDVFVPDNAEGISKVR